jgi:four helix bundle protein
MGNFNKLEVWEESKKLAILVFQITQKGDFGKDYSFRDQVRRAAISIPSNLAEGEESEYKKNSIKYFSIAKGSLSELRTQIDLAREFGYIHPTEYLQLSEMMVLLSKRIRRLIQFRQKRCNL